MNKTVQCEIQQTDEGFTLHLNGKPMLTPKKRPALLPTRALAEAMETEWADGKPYSTKTKPLSAIAFTAHDVTAPEREGVIAALLAYAETDLLCYRSETPELAKRQEEQWGGVLQWVERRYECSVQITEGIMPVMQSEQATLRFQKALEALSDMELSGVSVLVQVMGSLMLALAVLGDDLPVEQAFTLSRLDEDYQAERWGVDELAAKRAEGLRYDALTAHRFLTLLKEV